jgi:hypothetical protein
MYIPNRADSRRFHESGTVVVESFEAAHSQTGYLYKTENRENVRDQSGGFRDVPEPGTLPVGSSRRPILLKLTQ